MAVQNTEDLKLNYNPVFGDLIRDNDYNYDFELRLPFDCNEEVIPFDSNPNILSSTHEECNSNRTSSEDVIKTNTGTNRVNRNANNGTKRGKVGRKSLKSLGLSEEQIRSRIQTQNKCAQQRKRDKIKDEKRRVSVISVKVDNNDNTTSDSSQQLSHHNHNNDNNTGMYVMSGEQIHIYSDALEMAIKAVSDGCDANTANQYISFVLNNLRRLVSSKTQPLTHS